MSTWFPPHVMGGAEVNAQLLASFAARQGWDVQVLTGASVVPRGTPFRVHSVPTLRPRPSLLVEAWWAERRARDLAPLVPRGAIVHTFDVLARAVGAHLGRQRPDLRLVATIQDISPICGSIDGLLVDGSLCHGDTLRNLLAHQRLRQFGPLGQLTRAIRYLGATVRPYRRQLLGRYHALTTVSQFLKEFLTLERAEVIPDLLVPPHEACKLERTSAPTLVAIGRLGIDKGTDLVLQALTRLPAFLASFVGGGDVEFWRAEARRLGVADRVRFVGQVPIDEVGNWYHMADLAVLASRCPEASSRTLLEAMSCGRAVVAPNFGGPAELVTEGSTGRLFARGDAARLARAIEQAYSERGSLGQRAKQAARRYRPDVVGPEYLALYGRLGKGERAPALTGSRPA